MMTQSDVTLPIRDVLSFPLIMDLANLESLDILHSGGLPGAACVEEGRRNTNKIKHKTISTHTHTPHSYTPTHNIKSERTGLFLFIS